MEEKMDKKKEGVFFNATSKCMDVNINELAELIYNPHDNVYRDLFDNQKNANNVIIASQKEPNSFFNKKNFWLYQPIEERNPIGVLGLWKPGQEYDIDLEIHIREKAGMEITESFNVVSERYYVPSFNDEKLKDAVKFANFIIKDRFRGDGMQGTGKKYAQLMMDMTDMVLEQARLYLSVISNNIPAVKLYLKHGYNLVDVKNDYNGYDKENKIVMDIPCNFMEKTLKHPNQFFHNNKER
jgi:hypothetical protein